MLALAVLGGVYAIVSLTVDGPSPEADPEPAPEPAATAEAEPWIVTGSSIDTTGTGGVLEVRYTYPGGTSLTAPIRHGSVQLVPQDWTGPTEDPEPYHEPPVTIEPSFDHHGESNYRTTADLTEAQTYPYWRTPTLPAGWTLAGAHTSGEGATYGYCASFETPDGRVGLEIAAGYAVAVNRGFPTIASWSPNGDDLIVRETRVIAGRPAIVKYSPLGPTHNDFSRVVVHIHDPGTSSSYVLEGIAGTLRGANVEAVITIAASLFEPPNPP